MPKKICYVLMLISCVVLICGAALADLQQKGQSSEQEMRYRTEEGGLNVEYDIPFKSGGLEEYPRPDSLTASKPVVEPGQLPVKEDTTYSGTPVTPKYLGDQEVVTGEAPQAGESDNIGTLRENAAPDDTMRSTALPDAPVAVNVLREVADTESPEKDMDYRTTGLRESSGPDTIGREAPVEDRGVQEYADPYGPAPDLFAPKKKNQ